MRDRGFLVMVVKFCDPIPGQTDSQHPSAGNFASHDGELIVALACSHDECGLRVFEKLSTKVQALAIEKAAGFGKFGGQGLSSLLLSTNRAGGLDRTRWWRFVPKTPKATRLHSIIPA